MTKPQEVQHGDQPAAAAEVQHGTQPVAAETVNVTIGAQPEAAEDAAGDGDPGIAADYQGGDPVPEPEPQDEPETDVAEADAAEPAEKDD